MFLGRKGKSRKGGNNTFLNQTFFKQHQKNLSLPVGPREVGEAWYANARLGYSVWTLKAWSVRFPRGILYTVFSRCMEKGALYALELRRFAFAQMKADGFWTDEDTLRSWSDVGTHFLARTVMGTAAVDWMEEHRVLKTVHLLYGLGGHMKGDLDGWFGEMIRRLNEVATERYMISIGDLVREYTEYYTEHAARNPDGPKYRFYDFMPPLEKHLTPATNVTAKSLIVPLRSCYHWKFSRADVRRDKMIGKNMEVTGTEVRALLVPDAPGVAARTFKLVALPRGAPPEAGAEEEEAEAEAEPDCLHASDLHFQTQMYKGWRCSWRKTTPEDCVSNLERVLKALRKRRGQMQCVSTLLVGGARKTTLVMATGGVERKRVRQQRVLEEFRRLRVGRRELMARLVAV
jgi:hypothetical protein